MGTITLRIKSTITEDPNKSVDCYRKEFHIAGNSYCIEANTIKAFPADVGDIMLALDSDLELVDRT